MGDYGQYVCSQPGSLLRRRLRTLNDGASQTRYWVVGILESLNEYDPVRLWQRRQQSLGDVGTRGCTDDDDILWHFHRQVREKWVQRQLLICAKWVPIYVSFCATAARATLCHSRASDRKQHCSRTTKDATDISTAVLRPFLQPSRWPHRSPFRHAYGNNVPNTKSEQSDDAQQWRRRTARAEQHRLNATIVQAAQGHVRLYHG